jgi:uncharacterized protein
VSPNYSRRRFMRQAGAAVSALGAMKAAGALASPARGAAPASAPVRVFDAHLHGPAEKGELWQWHTVTRNFDEFVAYLDKTGVERGIVSSQRSQEKGTPAEFVAGNRETARFVEQSKGRFLGSCVVNPQHVDEALAEVEYCRRQLGFVWVGELCNYMAGYEYTIREFELLVRQVVRLGMVLQVHTENNEIDYLVEKFPEATLVFAHFGDEKEFDHIFKRIDLVAKHPNCYIDTSGYGHDRMGMLEYAVKTIGPDRVLFGSDFSINDPSTVLARIRNSFLTEEEKAKVLAGNLEALLARFPV